MKKTLFILIMTWLLGSNFIYAALIDNLTQHFSFDVAAYNQIGSSNITTVNSPTFTSGKINNAFTLASASTQYGTLANSAMPWGTNTLTVNVWAKINTTANPNAIVMVAETGQGFNMYENANFFQCDKPNVVSLSWSWTGHDSNWHMWTCVASSTGMSMYLDGTPVASNTNTTSYTQPGADLIGIGAYNNANVFQAGWYLDGQLDDLSISTRAWTPTDVSAAYAAGRGFDPLTPRYGSGFFGF